MLAKLVRKFRRGISPTGNGVQKAKSTTPTMTLNDRVNEVEKMLHAAVQPNVVTTNSAFEEMKQLLDAEIKSRERLERKLLKSGRKMDQKMDQLSMEFKSIRSQLTASNVDLDLEKRKNYELRKRITTQPKKNNRLKKD